LPEKFAGLIHDGEILRIEMSERGRSERAQHALRDGTRARTEENAFGGELSVGRNHVVRRVNRLLHTSGKIVLRGRLASHRLVRLIRSVNSFMSLNDKQADLIARYSIIEDTHERLAAIVARGQKWPASAQAERIDLNRVAGCVSPVWLVGEIENDRCRFRMSADSPLVQGLAALYCELYDNATPAEIVSIEPVLLEQLGLTRQLSPTRLNGLANVRRVIREFATRQLA
jgi:cysteine desulfuration protein SufE